MIRAGDTVKPINGPDFVQGEVKQVIKIDGISYADVVWNSPNLSRRMTVSRLKKLE